MSKKTLHLRASDTRVLIKVPEVDTKSKGGIELVFDKKLEQASQIRGTIVSMGEACWFGDFAKNPPKEGDEVYFAQYAGRSIMDPYTEEVYTIINDRDIVCVIEKPEEGENDE